jgi:hypothetical protein
MVKISYTSKYRVLGAGWCAFLALTCSQGFAADPVLQVQFLGRGLVDPKPQTLKTWGSSDLNSLKKMTLTEAAGPASGTEPKPGLVGRSGQKTEWHGAGLGEILDQSLATLPPDQKAQVDLVMFGANGGHELRIPRSLITKYPILVTASPKGGATIVFPLKSRSRIVGEGVPIQGLLDGVTQITLSSYRDQYSRLLLKHRMDPSAVRGEKAYLQNCLGCHGADAGFVAPDEARSQKLEAYLSHGHPSTSGLMKLDERDAKALQSYIVALRLEAAPSQASPTAQPTGERNPGSP